MEYAVPEDGTNINKTINVCTCTALSGEAGCTRPVPDDPDTLDLSNCNITDWGCWDGLQDISAVRRQ